MSANDRSGPRKSDPQATQVGLIGQVELRVAAFGENLTTESLFEADVWIGNRFRVGSAEFIVKRPREPDV
jgi:MOSC domain-containing protein YiiM